MIRSDTIRFLYDVEMGGKARAFECKLAHLEKAGKLCGAVTRTMRGMRLHQQLVHRFVPQSEMFGKE